LTGKAALAGRQAVPAHPTAHAGFAVYVHWPFCLAKCPYCDFNSHVRHQPPDQARYIAAFRREVAHRAALAPGRTVSSIFFGGGTPSLMEGATVGAILDAIGEHWAVDPNCEVSLEANPTSVEAGRFRDFRAAGVNRVSLGVQALNDADLKSLGRMHSAQEALDAVAIARKYFERYSFDLIYARSPLQTPALWRAELELAISHAAEHLSLYQLTIEAGTMRAPSSTRSRRRSRQGTACRSTRSRIMPAPAPNAGTIWSIGAMANMPASAPALMAGW
jgi:oxygen-independent coproporphyrinogen-3 oxidase